VDRSRDLLEDSPALAGSLVDNRTTKPRASARGVHDRPRWKGAKPPPTADWSRQKCEAIRAKHAWVRAQLGGAVPKPYDCTLGDDYAVRVAEGKLHPYPLVYRVCDRTKLPPHAKWRLTSRHLELLAHFVTAHLVVKSQGFIASHGDMARLIGCSERTAGTRVRELVAWGLLDRLPGFVPGGMVTWRARSVYRVTAFAITLFDIGPRRGRRPNRERSEGAELAGKSYQAELTGPSVRIRKGDDRQAVVDRQPDAGEGPAPIATGVKTRTETLPEAVQQVKRKQPGFLSLPAKAQAQLDQRMTSLVHQAAELATQAAAAAKPPRREVSPAAPHDVSRLEAADASQVAGRVRRENGPVSPAAIPSADELRREQGGDEAERARFRQIDEQRRRRRERERGVLGGVSDDDLADQIEATLKSHARGGEIGPVNYKLLAQLRRASDLKPPGGGGGNNGTGGAS
jgi:hypothetical protein